MDKTICVFGDSIVQAAYVNVSWLELLRKYLEEKYKSGFINVFNLCIGGNTSGDVLKRLKSESSPRTPTSIIFQFGVNDSGYFKSPDKPITEELLFKSNVEEIIKIAKSFTRDIYFLGLALGDDSILKPFPGSSRGKTYDTQRVKKYDEILKTIATQNGCKYVPLWGKLPMKILWTACTQTAQGIKRFLKKLKTKCSTDNSLLPTCF